MTTVKAHYDGKTFVPDEPVNLPAGTQVVAVVANGSSKRSPTMAALLKLAEEHPLLGAPSDLAEQHDHYAYGAPKK